MHLSVQGVHVYWDLRTTNNNPRTRVAKRDADGRDRVDQSIHGCSRVETTTEVTELISPSLIIHHV